MSSPALKKNEEKSLKVIRELITLPHNKQCVECGQKGPTYVDMTVTSFICTRCSGLLRGINPPHRVKSISMTTFNDEELNKLRKGGNEISRMIWCGKWDPVKDREVTTKNEQSFKEYLRDKYERKKWYRDPSEIQKSKTPEPQSNASTTKIATPPTNASKQPSVITSATSKSTPTVPGQSTVAPTATPTNPPTTSQQPNLLDGFDSDPFASKPPPGGVSVLPQVPAASSQPLLSTTKSTGDFGAFTSAPPQPMSGQGSGLLQPMNTSGKSGQPSTAPSQTQPFGDGNLLMGGGGDRYAALASLDTTLKEIRLKEEEKEKEEVIKKQQEEFQKQQQLQMQHAREQQLHFQRQQMGHAQQGGMMGGANPFGGVPPLQKKDSNPFLGGGHTPPVTGPPRSQGGFGQIGVAPQGGFGQAGFGQQPSASGFGNFTGQQPGQAQTGFGGVGFGNFGQQGGTGGFPAQQPPAAGQSGFGAFGQPAPPTQGGSNFGNFGQPAPPTQGGSNFGNFSQPAPPTQGGSNFGNFGQPAPPTQGGSNFGNFGQPAQGGSNFGNFSQPAAPTQGGSNFGNFGQPAQGGSSNFSSFGQPAAPPTQGGGGGFGAFGQPPMGGQGGTFGSQPNQPGQGFNQQQTPQAIFGAQNSGLSPVLSPGDMKFGSSPVMGKQQFGTFGQTQPQPGTGSKPQQQWGGMGTGTSAGLGTGSGNMSWSTNLSAPAVQQQPSSSTGWSNATTNNAGNMTGWGSGVMGMGGGPSAGGWGTGTSTGQPLQPTSFTGSGGQSRTNQMSGSNPFI